MRNSTYPYWFTSNEYSQEFHYYSFSIKLDWWVGNCNALNDLSNKVCIPNKTENLNLSLFNMITGINESKTLTKHISCECRCKFDEKRWWNNDRSRCECKKHNVCEKDYVWNPAKCNCENGKYLASIIDDPTIICNEVIKSYDEEVKTIPTNFNEKKVTCKMQSFYISLVFSFIAIALLIAVSIYCYLIKHRRKHLLPFRNTNNKWNKFCIDSINWKWVLKI